ncbi:hypothetical protein CT154_08375 [Komagataeibacter xylinus]|nr:hypothetical protein CT154_08375 [Komagataeibacter xylinus]
MGVFRGTRVLTRGLGRIRYCPDGVMDMTHLFVMIIIIIILFYELLTAANSFRFASAFPAISMASSL